MKVLLLFNLTVRASNLLEAYGLKPILGCINSLKDKKGKFYYIPNFCVNDPWFEKSIKSPTNERISKIINVLDVL